jgi:hypothetical protein
MVESHFAPHCQRTHDGDVPVRQALDGVDLVQFQSWFFLLLGVLIDRRLGR